MHMQTFVCARARAHACTYIPESSFKKKDEGSPKNLGLFESEVFHYF